MSLIAPDFVDVASLPSQGDFACQLAQSRPLGASGRWQISQQVLRSLDSRSGTLGRRLPLELLFISTALLAVLEAFCW